MIRFLFVINGFCSGDDFLVEFFGDMLLVWSVYTLFITPLFDLVVRTGDLLLTLGGGIYFFKLLLFS